MMVVEISVEKERVSKRNYMDLTIIKWEMNWLEDF